MSNILCDKAFLNTRYVEYVTSLYDNSWNTEVKIKYINYLIYFQTLNVTTKFSNSFLEKELCKISSSLDFALSDEFKDRSVLHVMSEAYSTGGHTKLLELFIENCFGYFSEQSVVVTNQVVEFPNSLKDIVEKNGKLIFLNNSSIITKSVKLANISSKYHYIVLHIHPEDIVPTIAFGNNYFQRPILFLNHADHLFWCGVSVSDIVLDLSKEGGYFSTKIRGVKKSKTINIPIADKNVNITKNEAKKYLNIDQDKKIILSIASEYKYGNTKDEIFKFVDMAINILNKVKNSEFLLIGPSKENEYWNEAFELSQGRLKPLGLKDRDSLSYYIVSSDLYIESFPFASYTAFLDTAQYNIKMISLNTPTFTLDTIKDNNLLANSIQEIENRAVKFLNQIDTSLEDIDISVHLKDKWCQNIIEIFENNKKLNHNIVNFIEKDAEYIYINHVNNVVKSNNNIFGEIYNELPFMLKLKMLFSMKKYYVIISNKFMFKLFRKIIKGTIRGK